jgi:hypothetical protein
MECRSDQSMGAPRGQQSDLRMAAHSVGEWGSLREVGWDGQSEQNWGIS